LPGLRDSIVALAVGCSDLLTRLVLFIIVYRKSSTGRVAAADDGIRTVFAAPMYVIDGAADVPLPLLLSMLR